jgi:hypothetical protein
MRGEMPHRKVQKSRIQVNKPANARARIGTDALPVDPVDRLLATDPFLIRLGTEVRKLQRLLKEACSEEAWRIYLRIEELMNERMFSFADKWMKSSPPRRNPTAGPKGS